MKFVAAIHKNFYKLFVEKFFAPMYNIGFLCSQINYFAPNDPDIPLLEAFAKMCFFLGFV